LEIIEIVKVEVGLFTLIFRAFFMKFTIED